VFLAQAGEPFDSEKLGELVEQSQAERQAWLGQQEQVMTALLEEARAHPRRARLSEDESAALAKTLAAFHEAWYMGTVTPSNRVACPDFSATRLRDLVERERARAVAAAARDLYSAGPAERASLPDEILLPLEAELRCLRYNRPHRLGGIHQAVQDTSAPPGKLLLLQLGADDPTGFNWGDSGALFAWIGLDALACGDFGHIEWWTENT
jgi:hypothetical protein